MWEISRIAERLKKFEEDRKKTGGKRHEIDLRVRFRELLIEVLRDHKIEVSVFEEEFEKKTAGGKRIDLIIKGVLFETKNEGSLKGETDKEKAIQQIYSYMISEGIAHGVLVDFEKVIFIELDKDGNPNVSEVREWNLNSFIRILDLMVNKGKRRYISEFYLTQDFTPKAKPVKSLIQILYEFIKNCKREEQKKIFLLFQEWKKIFKLSGTTVARPYEEERRVALKKITEIDVGEKNEYQVLFCLHTALAMILKTIMASLLNKLTQQGSGNLSNNEDLKNFYKEIESGELFRKIGIKNFCNYDFFSWYLEVEWGKEFRDILLDILQISSLYEHLKGKRVKDVLQRLYFEFIPREVRHSFGEYYTPDYIADYMVNEYYSLTDDKNFLAIDPTCGSGTFLISLIKLKRELEVGLCDILRQVVGIDLNPTAVIMSRFNYLNAILDLVIDAGFPPIEIPVYIGDSSYTPTKKVKEGTEFLVYDYYFHEDNEYNIKVSLPEIWFPTEFVKSERFVDILIEIERKIEGNESEEIVISYLLEEIKKVTKLNKCGNEKIEKLIRQIYECHNKGLNMIWLYIFMNYLRPFALGEYDLIIGNPPWVRWSNLPEAYREKIKRTLRSQGLFSRDKNYGGVDLNICALIVYRSVENLGKNSCIAFFILPRGILTNKSYEGFRSWGFGNKNCSPMRIYIPRTNFFSGEEPIILMLNCGKFK